MSKVFLGLGTNIGNRELNLLEAVSKIDEHAGRVLNTSSVYETAPWGFSSENVFLNLVIEVETNLSPADLMSTILTIEASLGRVRSDVRYTSRIIDIDILLYDDQVIDEKDLTIPHPLMHERKFVLVPLNEIAPELVHPLLNKTISNLLAECSDVSVVIKVLNPFKH